MFSLFDDRGGATVAPRAMRLAEYGGLLACCAPLFMFSMKGWPNAMLYLGSIAAMILLARRDLAPLRLDAAARRWLLALVIAYTAPILATLISSLLREDVRQEYFDAPSRFLLGIPLVLFAVRSRLRTGLVVQWVVFIALVAGLASLEIYGSNPKWEASRASTLSVDPIVFGYLTLAFALMCLVSISPHGWRTELRVFMLLRVAGVLIGVWLSVRSGTRSGWAGVPIVVGVWLHHHWGRAHRLATAAVIAVAVLVPVAAYLAMPHFHARIDEMVAEFTDYWRQPVQPNTSVALRISYLRMAADIFLQHPIAGIGDITRVHPASLGSFSYATPRAVHDAFIAGFHNQLVSNAVRLGVAGLLATALLLFVPLLVCARGLRHGRPGETRDAMLGLAFTTILVVSSMTTEIVDLKVMASLYTVMTALLCGSALARSGEAPVARP